MQLDDTTPKVCATCGEEKTRSQFYKNIGMPDGRLKHCITCVKRARKEHYPEIAEVERERQRKRFAEDPKHRQRQNNRAKQWKIDNRARWLERQREYYRDHKDQQRENGRRRYETRSEWVRRLKDGRSCVRCGISDTRVLQWHHRDPATKIFNISDANTANDLKEEEVLAEVEKCDTICANCHAIMHWEEREAKRAGRIKQTTLPL